MHDKPGPYAANGSVCVGTPLHRLQDLKEAPLASDVADVLALCKTTDEVTTRLASVVKGRHVTDRVSVSAEDVAHVTALFLAQ